LPSGCEGGSALLQILENMWPPRRARAKKATFFFFFFFSPLSMAEWWLDLPAPLPALSKVQSVMIVMMMAFGDDG
jgi:polyferredoxin